MNFKIENWKLIVVSAFYFIFAFVSYNVPAEEFLSFFRIAGIAITVAGALQILVYFLKKDYMKPQDFTFSLGLLLIFAGLVVCTKAEFIVLNYRPVIGVVVVLDSILRMQYSMNLLRVNDNQWKIHTVLAVLPAILGVVLVVLDLGSLVENYFSFLLILDGIANIYTVLYYRRFVKQAQRSMINHDNDQEDVEISVVEQEK